MKPRHRRALGIALGAVVGAAVLAWLGAEGSAALHAPGPMNTGHGDTACAACHRPAPGTLRQQLQNAARSWLGAPHVEVDIGYRAVTPDECLACHDRPDDRHPGFRFLEPRFAEARARLAPERCTSCHLEHAGVRVTLADPTYCRHCHADLVLDRDPLDVSHRELVTTRRWDTCLGCHDYHGNHAHRAPRRLEEALPPAAIRGYLDGGPSPYGAPIRRATNLEVKTL